MSRSCDAGCPRDAGDFCPNHACDSCCNTLQADEGPRYCRDCFYYGQTITVVSSWRFRDLIEPETLYDENQLLLPFRDQEIPLP